MSQYLATLVKIAQEDMPSLQYDIQNASTQFTLLAGVQRLFNVVAYLLHHTIEDAYANMGAPIVATRPTAAPQAPAPQAPQAPQAPIPAASHVPVMYAGMLPRPQLIAQPNPIATPTPGMPSMAPSGVANVMITPQGTQVIPPAGAGPAINLPPGSSVDLAAMTGRPELPPAAPGVTQIVLPPGGALSPGVAAAIAARSPAPPASPMPPVGSNG
jgi:hypothetical protein